MKDVGIGIVILAAGKGARYRLSGGRGHKLLALHADAAGNVQPLLALTLHNATQSGLPVALVCHPDAAEIQAIAASFQAQIIPFASNGSGETIAAGVRATADWDGWLILPGDMGWVTADDIQQVARALQNGAQQARLCWQDKPGHPVGFAKQYQHALAQLTGDSGAKGLLDRDVLVALAAAERAIRDADFANH